MSCHIVDSTMASVMMMMSDGVEDESGILWHVWMVVVGGYALSDLQ
jgi:hypothetical protein